MGATNLNSAQLSALPIDISNDPKEGPRAMPVRLDFSAGGTVSYMLDIGQIINSGKLSGIQALYIDNSLNNAALTIAITPNGQNITAPPNSQGFYPALISNAGQITFTMTNGIAVSNVQLLNVATPYLIWGSQGIGGFIFNGSGYALVSDPVLEALISGGALTTKDQGLDAIISGGKLPVSDAALEAIISAGALKTADQGLDPIISGGALTTKDTGLDAIIFNAALSVAIHGRGYVNITTATTTVVKAAAGTLTKILINTYVASATITLYDNNSASGTKIGTLTLPSTITGDAPVYLSYDLSFATGLTIVTSGAVDLTVLFI